MSEPTPSPGASPPSASEQRRPSEVARLRDFLAAQGVGVSTLSVSGPGGVGKTFLVDDVVRSALASDYVVLRADGASPESRGDFFAILEGLFPRALPPPARVGEDYFPRLRDLAKRHRQLTEAALTDMERKGATEEQKAVARTLLRAALVLNRRYPPSRRLVDIAAVGQSDVDVQRMVDDATTILRGLSVLRDSTFLPGPVRDLLGVTRDNRIKNDLHRLVAEELRTDLSAAIAGYEKRDAATRITHAKIPGVTRLLIVLDDYELIGPTLDDFLISALLRELDGAPFPTKVLLVGRDELVNTHPGWEQHAKRSLRGEIRLRAFDRPTTEEMLRQAGVDESRIASVWEATRGYPYLVGLAIEEAESADAEAAMFLRRFVERTTRWMLPHERDWFLTVVYLDAVNEDTLEAFFEPADVPRVQRWFEQDASVRDPSARTFQVRPFIRERVLRYLEIRGPRVHREKTLKAAKEPRPA